jgi:tetratricopeptide (TPR) repeat protein
MPLATPRGLAIDSSRLHGGLSVAPPANPRSRPGRVNSFRWQEGCDHGPLAAALHGSESMPRLLLSVPVCLLSVCLLRQTPSPAAESAWELRGEVVAVANDAPRLVELRLPDGSLVRVPLAAFSEKSRSGILSAAAEAKPPAKAVQEALGSPLAVVEEAVARCRTADEAVRALSLWLAGGEAGVSEADAAAALERWKQRAKRGDVRLGREWVSPDVAAAAARAGDDLLTEVATMVRLGNIKSLRDYLEKASRADPNSGRADFLLGLAQAFGVGQRADMDKALRQFAEVVAREPRNGAALNNLAVCEVAARRFDDAVAHFAAAADRLPESPGIAANVALVVAGANDRRSKLSAKQTEAFSALYRRLVPGQPGQGPPPLQSGPTFLSPFGQPVAAQSNFADLFIPPAGNVVERRGIGVVVAPKIVLVPATVPFSGGSLVVRMADGTGGELPAEWIATSQDQGIALLRCEQLVAQPVSLAATVPSGGGELMAVQPATRSPAGSRSASKPGSVVALGVLPEVFVHTAAVADDRVGCPLVDAGGRVIGFTAATPEITLPGSPRAFGTPIERIWPFLRDHLPDLEPAESAESSRSWDAVAVDVSAGLVDVVARPAP